jgi:hypothetical protein
VLNKVLGQSTLSTIKDFKKMENQRPKTIYITVILLAVKIELTAIEKAAEKMATCYERQCNVCQTSMSTNNSSQDRRHSVPLCASTRDSISICRKYLIRMGTIFFKMKRSHKL